jgi:hypothetical protein
VPVTPITTTAPVIRKIVIPAIAKGFLLAIPFYAGLGAMPPVVSDLPVIAGLGPAIPGANEPVSPTLMLRSA